MIHWTPLMTTGAAMLGAGLVGLTIGYALGTSAGQAALARANTDRARLALALEQLRASERMIDTARARWKRCAQVMQSQAYGLLGHIRDIPACGSHWHWTMDLRRDVERLYAVADGHE